MMFLWLFKHACMWIARLTESHGSSGRVKKFSESLSDPRSLQVELLSFTCTDFLQRTYGLSPAEVEVATHTIMSDPNALEFDPNPFFDTDFYATKYSAELTKSSKSPFAYYLSEGAALGHMPSPIFGSFLSFEAFERFRSFVPSNKEQIFKDLFVGHADASSSPSTPPKASEVSFRGLNFSNVAILVPVFNNWMWTERCLRALQNCSGVHQSSVYVVDDFSSDNTTNKIERRFPWVRVLRNPENLGFLRSCNRAFELVRKDHDFVLLLNNDTEPHPQFLAELLQTMISREEVALSGSKLVYPDGLVQEAGGIVWSDASGWNYGRKSEDSLELITSRSVDYISGASVLIRVSAIEGGLFDEEFLPAYYEDTDLAFRLRSEGSVVQYVPYSIVIHHEGKSHGTDPSSGVKKYQLTNQARFAKKWAQTLSQHHSPDPLAVMPAALRLEIERSRGVILWIDYQLPDPTRDSGSVRAVEVAKLLRELGYLVIFVPQNGDFLGLNPYWLAREGVHLQRSLSTAYNLLSRLGLSPDTVILSRVTVAKEFFAKIRGIFPNARIVFDTVDLHFLRLERQALSSNSSSLESVASRTREVELDLIGKADTTLVVSDAELALLRKINPKAEIEVVSNIHQQVLHLEKPVDALGMVFVGSFNHPPNEEGIRWFLDRVWPKLPQEVRSEGLRIVGPNPPTWLKNFADQDVQVMGWVESSMEVVSSSRVSIAPILSGAGVKGKVGEAMTAQTPVVGTSIALEGMGLVDSESCLIADAPEEFAMAITYLFQHPKDAVELASKAFEVLERKFGPLSAKVALSRALRI